MIVHRPFEARHMSLSKFSGSLFLMLAVGSLSCGNAKAATPPAPDFSGVWQLNDAQSDSASDVNKRYHVEKKHEEAPSANTSNNNGAAPSTVGDLLGGGGGGHHGGGGGGGHGGGGGNHDYEESHSFDKNKGPVDPTPPLFADDALLNIQQRTADMQVDFNNTDRLDTKFDSVTRPSLNGTAQIQTQLSSDGMHLTMEFSDGTRLEQDWVKSADGHHLTVTETWTPVDMKQPIVFKRVYDQLGAQ
jgi:hypothetical protein